MAQTTAAFLTAVRRRAMLPQNVGRGLLDDDILAIANEELQSNVQAYVSRVNGERDVTSLDYILTAGQDKYRIPPIAVGDSVRDVLLKEGDVFYPLEYLEPERAFMDVQGFYFEGDNIVLTPPPQAGGTIRVKVYRSLPRLVATAPTNEVLGASGSGLTVTTPLTAPDYFDIQTEDGDFVARGLWLVSGTTNAYAFSQEPRPLDPSIVSYISLPAGARNRAYLVPSGESYYLPIPEVLEPVLTLRTVAAVLSSLGNPQAPSFAQRADILEEKALATLQPRSRGRAPVVLNRNGPGFNRGKRSYWRR